MTRPFKLHLILAALSEGPQTAKTLCERGNIHSLKSLGKLLAEISGLRKKYVDAGCRQLLVYWLEGTIQKPRPKIIDYIENIEQRVEAGGKVKVILRELNLPHHPNYVWNVLGARRKQREKDMALSPGDTPIRPPE